MRYVAFIYFYFRIIRVPFLHFIYLFFTLKTTSITYIIFSLPGNHGLLLINSDIRPSRFLRLYSLSEQAHQAVKIVFCLLQVE